MTTRVVLSAGDFVTLISGGCVRAGDCEIILQDIGFAAMRGYLELAETGGAQTTRGVCRLCGDDCDIRGDICRDCDEEGQGP